ncbi:MAG: glycosyltransferase family 4 protein [Cyanobacteria bacterium]|nr:glycosyltransferase family 4 protein [Cyanobacteria bacterium bin.51]
MNIAQIAPLYESVPPDRYGGTERVVHYLTEELVRRGHDVVLFASGDSQTSADLCACVPKALRCAGYGGDPSIQEVVQLDRVNRQLDHFDIVHFHNSHVHFPLMNRLGRPHLSTVHGSLETAERIELYRHFDQLPLVSISDSQRQPVPAANWVGTVHHGLPTDLYRFSATPAPYLAFVGRISPEKRLDRAIEIALACGLPLKVAAKVDPSDRAYFHTMIEPLLDDNPTVDMVGEVDDAGKQELLGNALALLFPIDWQEPFGLVMIEANACGTPVIAWRNGSTPELIDDGVNGYLVESIEEAKTAVQRLDRLDRYRIRGNFEVRFSATRQAEDYEQLYRHLIQADRSDSPADRSRQAPLVHA